MTLWMAWTVFTSALVAIAATALERVVAHVALPRRFVWLAAIVVTTIVPIAVALRPPAQIESHAVNPRVVMPPVPSAGSLMAMPDIDAPIVITAPRVSAATTFLVVANRALPWAWLAASVMYCLVLVRAVLRLQRERRRWRPASTEVGPVLVSPNAGPAVVGFFRPRIVVPEWALAADGPTRTILLRHELEHLRAGDSRALFATALAQLVFPWNAGLSWMARRLRVAIEIDCDARVIRAVGTARAYGLVLLAVGERHAAAMPMAAGLSEPGTNLEMRIHAMTTPRQRRPLAASLPPVVLMLAVLTTAAWTPLPKSFVQARSAPQRPDSVKPKPLVVVQPTKANARAMLVRRVPSAPAPRLPMVVRSVPAAPPPTGVGPVVVQRAEPRPLRGNPTPRYPDSLRFTSTDGHVLLRVTTNAGGVPDTSTVDVVEATNDAFVAAVRKVLPSWRFDSGGLVRMVFEFTITGSDRDDRPHAAHTIDGVTPLAVVITAIPLVRPSPDSVQEVASTRGSTSAGKQTEGVLGYFGWDRARLETFLRTQLPPAVTASTIFGRSTRRPVNR